MAVITKSIGTASRDYSTISSWEGAAYGATASDSAVGECYNDSTFSETVDINDTTPTAITLTAASGERHDGTAASGVKVQSMAGNETIGVSADDDVTVSWIEVTESGTPGEKGIEFDSAGTNPLTVANCLVYSLSKSDFYAHDGVGIYSSASGATMKVINCIIYDIAAAGTGGNTTAGVWLNGGTIEVYNTTIHDIAGGANNGYCIDGSAGSSTAKNVIGTDASTTDLNFIGTSSYNLSSDTSASGTGSLTSKTAANQFVSTTGGSEDLHLKAGSDAEDAGTDLGTTPSGVEVDIDGRNRDTEGDTWDMGAHEYVAAGGGGTGKRAALVGTGF